ncbi:DNA-binding protein [Methylobacterium oryzae]|uniref:KfrA N-terminal DNA-binding domain-containing protein n=1 Tax=Methylobacterium oryzae TaxID=334852 RepID=A0ABU7TRH2_9HYPH
MVAENEVWQAADRIRVRQAPPGGVKERVSVRTVRKELGGGSFGDIARSLARWKVREDYLPVIEQADLPEAFGRRLGTIGRELLEMARVEAARARLADFVEADQRRATERDVLDEALSRVDLLEERIAAMQAELDRLRAAAPAPATGALRDPAPEGRPAASGREGVGLVDAAHGGKLAREADVFWREVWEAVESVVGQRGPLAIHPLFKALPASLKADGARMGFPLTPAWLRYHLLRMAEDGDGLAVVGHRFALAGTEAEEAAPPGPHAAERVEAPSGRRFWREVIREVHALLCRDGPKTAEAVLAGIEPGRVDAARRFQGLTPGLLRWKLRQRIKERRPFRELADGRFAAIPCDGPWDGLAPATGVQAGRRSAQGKGTIGA